jgi:hypothetical protein
VRPGVKNLAAMMLAAMLGLPCAARASDLDLSWSAPAGCPERASLQQGIARRLGRPIALGSDAPVRVRGVISAAGSGYTLALETRLGDVSEERSLSARGCNELARAVILTASLLLVPGAAAPERAHAGHEDDRAPRSWHIAVRAQLALDAGSLPRVALGPALALGVIVSSLQLELGGSYFPEQSIDAGSPRRQIGAVGLWAGRASVCRELWSALELAPCATFELGRIIVSGDALQHPEHAGATWLSTQIGLRFGVALVSGLHWQSELAIGVPLHHVELASHELGTVARVSSVVGRFGTGFELRW